MLKVSGLHETVVEETQHLEPQSCLPDLKHLIRSRLLAQEVPDTRQEFSLPWVRMGNTEVLTSCRAEPAPAAWEVGKKWGEAR